MAENEAVSIVPNFRSDVMHLAKVSLRQVVPRVLQSGCDDKLSSSLLKVLKKIPGSLSIYPQARLLVVV